MQNTTTHDAIEAGRRLLEKGAFAEASASFLATLSEDPDDALALRLLTFAWLGMRMAGQSPAPPPPWLQDQFAAAPIPQAVPVPAPTAPPQPPDPVQPVPSAAVEQPPTPAEFSDSEEDASPQSFGMLRPRSRRKAAGGDDARPLGIQLGGDD